MTPEAIIPIIAHATVATAVAVAACIDLRCRRVPNWLTFSLAIAGLLAALVRPDLSLAQSAGGMAIGLAIPFVLFAFGMLGAGDAKLLAAAGAWLGPWAIVWVLLISGVAGGVMSIVTAVGRGQLRPALRNTAVVGMSLLLTRRTNWTSATDAARDSADRQFTLPYAFAILVGVLVTQLLVLSGTI